jgi:predicted nucleic acid-binding Zn ribbon protein
VESEGMEEERRCVICGLKVGKDATQCPHCGNILTSKQGPECK